MTFATSIHCMDGRVQLPIIHYMQEKYKVKYLDVITEPGPNKILSETRDEQLVQSIKNRIDISVHKHGSALIAISGRADCAGNPADKNTQLKQIEKCVSILKQWYTSSVQIISLWIDENFKVHAL